VVLERRWLVSFACLTAGTATAGLPRLSAQTFSGPVAEKIRRALVDSAAPSIAVAVAKNGRIIWEEGFGWANREAKIPATEHTVYSLASISKPITTTGLMVLVERGLIDLDRQINEYLGAVRIEARVGDAADATVRRAANHTAGLPLHYSYWHADELGARPSIDETIGRYGNLITAPGERWLYSNLGYAMLAEVIARVSRQSFAEFMRTQVFLPLGLTNTTVSLGPGPEPRQAIRYQANGSPWPFYLSDHPGGGSTTSSAHDLVRFGMFHLKNHLPDQQPILSDRSIDRMRDSSVVTGRTDHYARYALGWATSSTSLGHQMVSHSGTIGGASTYLDLLPAANVAVVVLGNGDNAVPAMIRREILIALGYERRDVNPAPPAASPFQPPADLIGTWRGTVHTYRGQRPLRLTIEATGLARAQLGGQSETVVQGAGFRNGFFRGRMAGDVGTPDAGRRSYDLRFDVKLRGNVLNGGLIATSPWPGRDRLGNALTHWVELRRD